MQGPDAAVNIKAELDATGQRGARTPNGNPIYHARQGDPRRSTIFWVNQEQNAGPLGYGPPLFDVETGETISGQAYIYGAALDTYAAYSRDLVLLATGSRSTRRTYIVGTNVRTWVQRTRPACPTVPKTHRRLDDVRKMRRRWTSRGPRARRREAPIETGDRRRRFMNSLKNREDAMYKGGIFGAAQRRPVAGASATTCAARSSKAMMITPDIMAMGGAAPGNDWTSLSEAEKIARLAAALAGGRARRSMRAWTRCARSATTSPTSPTKAWRSAALARATIPSIPNMDPEAIRQKLRKDIFLASRCTRSATTWACATTSARRSTR